MAENSKIEWCDHTVNLWWGCSKVHTGCKNCYAEYFSDTRYKNNLWGDHKYQIRKSLGFDKGQTLYVDAATTIQFVQKNDDGTMIEGLQSEQLAYVLLDRCIKLNERFPSEQNKQMIAGLEMFLAACKDRVEERMNRGVMGELKK